MPDFKPIPLTETQMAELFRLRQRVQELEKDCDEYHQVALNHIHANEKLTAERDALKKQRDDLVAALENIISPMASEAEGGLDELAEKVAKAKAAIANVKEKA